MHSSLILFYSYAWIFWLLIFLTTSNVFFTEYDFFLTDHGSCWGSRNSKEDAWLFLYGRRALCEIIGTKERNRVELIWVELMVHNDWVIRGANHLLQRVFLSPLFLSFPWLKDRCVDALFFQSICSACSDSITYLSLSAILKCSYCYDCTVTISIMLYISWFLSWLLSRFLSCFIS